MRTVAIKVVWVELMPDFYEENTVYISEKYKTAKHLCLCGCGSMTIMPIDGNKKWWGLTKHDESTVSFTGSVGNYGFDCKSHYVIERNLAKFLG